jgi:hypothetical protein
MPRWFKAGCLSDSPGREFKIWIPDIRLVENSGFYIKDAIRLYELDHYLSFRFLTIDFRN